MKAKKLFLSTSKAKFHLFLLESAVDSQSGKP